MDSKHWVTHEPQYFISYNIYHYTSLKLQLSLQHFKTFQFSIIWRQKLCSIVAVKSYKSTNLYILFFNLEFDKRQNNRGRLVLVID